MTTSASSEASSEGPGSQGVHSERRPSRLRPFLPDGDLGWVPLLALAAVLRVAQLWSTSLGVDDGVSILTASRPLATMFADMLATHEVHPPLYFYWLHLWVVGADSSAIALMGVEAWFRCSTLAWSLLVVFLVHLVGREVAAHRVAFGAALLVGVSDFLVYHAGEVRMYPMLAALLLLATWGVLRLDRHGSPLGPALAWLAGALGAFFTHYLAVFFILPLGAWLMLDPLAPRPGKGRRLGRVALAAAVLLPLVLWLGIVRVQAGSQVMLLRDSPGWPQLVELMFQLTCGVTWPLPLAGWPELAGSGQAVAGWKWAGCGVCAWALAGAWNLAPARRTLLLALVTGPVLGVIAVSTLTSVRIFEYKYFQPVAPFLFLAMACWLGASSRRARGTGLAVLVLTVVINAASLVELGSRPLYYGPQDWRGVLRSLQPRLRDGDQVVVHPSMMASPVWVYAFYEDRFLFTVQQGGVSLRVVGADAPDDAALVACEASAGRLFYLTTMNHPYVQQQRLLDALLARWAVVSAEETPSFWPANRIQVLVLERRQAHRKQIDRP